MTLEAAAAAVGDAAAAASRPAAIHVPLGERAYDVLVGEGLIADAGRHIRAATKCNRVHVVSDEVVAVRHLGLLEAALRAADLPISRTILPEGEGTKSFVMLEQVVDDILSARLERTDAVVALGGGVIGDLAGFAAAIAKRGLPFVQVPTTLLAQVDSAVGGKTGINTCHGKNLVGAFHQPALVLADLATLDTLPDRHVRAGYAEIVKMALIDDAAMFARLEALGPGALTKARAETIGFAIAGKAAIVVEDERETGRRALLNLGHTFAHAVERVAGYDGRIVHGEAVGLGLALAFRFSAALGFCAPADARRVAAHLGAVGLPTTFADAPVTPTAAALTDAMAQDKKVKNGAIRFVLANRIGDAFLSDGVPSGALASFLKDEGLPTE